MSYGWRRSAGIVTEICDECGFDSRRIRSAADGLVRTLTELEELAADPDAQRRPAPEVWSAAEYIEHCLHVLAESLTEVAEAARVPFGEPAASCAAGAAAVRLLALLVPSAKLAALSIEVPFAQITGTDNLLHALHDLQHHALDIRRGYAHLNLRRGEDLHTVSRYPLP